MPTNVEGTMKKIISVISACTATILFPFVAMAQQGADAGGAGEFQFKSFLAIAAGFAIAIASVGGAIGQGKVAAAAMAGISRNPEAAGKVMMPMIIALALIESLVIYALVIAFLLQGKI